MTAPYYADELVTLYHGNCLEILAWMAADVLVTDPPYGRQWRQGLLKRRRRHGDNSRDGIAGDSDPAVRDEVLAIWTGTRPAIVFGDLMLAPPAGTKLVGIYRKPLDAGTRGAIAGLRRDVEAINFVGPWSSGIGGRSSVFATLAASQGNPSSTAGRYQHPHAKPGDVMEQLLELCPPGVIADPFAGSGSTLAAAKRLGRRAIGVELMERDCEMAARRLDQGVLAFGGAR